MKQGKEQKQGKYNTINNTATKLSVSASVRD